MHAMLRGPTGSERGSEQILPTLFHPKEIVTSETVVEHLGDHIQFSVRIGDLNDS